ncbi:MAG TPA: enolase C-terminal domain-like protein [Actinomycetota bacterium]|nr:enolase C-terminal domain-like protein [Actinomycetota bacterium]
MKLTSIQTFIVDLPKRRAHNWAGKMSTPIGSHLLVRLGDDEGHVGWGEAPAIPTWGGPHMRYSGEAPNTAELMIRDHLWPAIEGRSPLEPAVLHGAMDSVVKGNPYAKAALDIACFDLTGRALGVPVSTLLGGRVRDRVEVCHSLGIMDDDPALDEAEGAVAEGIGTIKVKTGVDPERDVRLVRRLREHLGDDVRIRVDANEGYASVAEAVGVTRRQVAEAGIFLCEQPMRGARALAEVARRIDVPVMADESAWTPQDVIELAELHAAEVISLYVAKPGGLHRAREQAVVAEAFGMTSDIGGSIEMGIGNAANLQLGAATPIAVLPSVCPVSSPKEAGPGIAGNYYTDDVIAEPLRFERGALLVPEGPGLGIEVDEEKVRAYAR